MRLIDKLYGNTNAETTIVSHFNRPVDNTNEILKKCLEDCLNKSETAEEFKKSWSTDLQKRFPTGRWITVRGSRVFIKNGKVIAGLEGFNKEIDKFFEGKKKEGGNNELQKRTDKLIKEYYEKDKGIKERVVKRGVAESTAKIEAKKRGNGFSAKLDENEKGKFKVVHNVKGDAEGLTFDQYKEKYGKQLEITAKNQLGYESKQPQQQSKGKKESQLYNRLMSGETLKLKDARGNDMEVKYAEDKYGVSKGVQIFQGGKKVSDRAMKKDEIKNYLSQFEDTKEGRETRRKTEEAFKKQ